MHVYGIMFNLIAFGGNAGKLFILEAKNETGNKRG